MKQQCDNCHTFCSAWRSKMAPLGEICLCQNDPVSDADTTRPKKLYRAAFLSHLLETIRPFQFQNGLCQTAAELCITRWIKTKRLIRLKRTGSADITPPSPEAASSTGWAPRATSPVCNISSAHWSLASHVMEKEENWKLHQHISSVGLWHIGLIHQDWKSMITPCSKIRISLIQNSNYPLRAEKTNWIAARWWVTDRKMHFNCLISRICVKGTICTANSPLHPYTLNSNKEKLPLKKTFKKKKRGGKSKWKKQPRT